MNVRNKLKKDFDRMEIPSKHPKQSASAYPGSGG